MVGSPIRKKERDAPYLYLAKNFLAEAVIGILVVRVVPVEVHLAVVRIVVAVRDVATLQFLLPSSVRVTECRFHSALGYAFQGTPRRGMKGGTQFLNNGKLLPSTFEKCLANLTADV